MKGMSRPSQLLVLDPADELVFKRSSGGTDEELYADLEITNPTPYPICFKVKATASRRYSVRPKVGLLLPYSRRQVLFKLREPPILTEDRFKILTTVKPEDAKGTDPAELWGYVLESACMQSKLRVSLDPSVEVGGLPRDTQVTPKRLSILKWFFYFFLLTGLTAIGITLLPNIKFLPKF